jgi:hypothetical protein
MDRGQEATASQVDSEIDALLALLKQVGLGDEIRRYYQPLGEAGEITQAEFNALPEPVRKYINKLKREILDLHAQKGRMEDRIRRTNWGGVDRKISPAFPSRRNRSSASGRAKSIYRSTISTASSWWFVSVR